MKQVGCVVHCLIDQKLLNRNAEMITCGKFGKLVESSNSNEMFKPNCIHFSKAFLCTI